MIQLPHGCYCTGTPGDPRKDTDDTLPVFPANWKKDNASIRKKWRIHYRFYDPRITTGQFAKGKLVVIKKMNKFNTLAERQAAVQVLIKNELSLLKDKGYNPITEQYEAPEEIDYVVDPRTGFIAALRSALKDIAVEPNTRVDINSKIKYVEEAAKQLRMDKMYIIDVRRKHIKTILGRIKANRQGTWSDNTYNAYLKYLRILFNELLEWEATDTNPITDIKRKKVDPAAPKKVPTPEECQLIDQFVKKYDPAFHRLIHMFFHSGSRTTEMFRLQAKHVDLKKGVATYKVKKGRQFRWVLRPIKNVVLHMWQEQLRNAKPDDYIFSVGLLPGPRAIRPDQIKRRWARHIQGKLNIDCTWYALKYLNTDQTAELLDIKKAAKQNGHTTPVITMGYAIGEKARELEELKNVSNPFGS